MSTQTAPDPEVVDGVATEIATRPVAPVAAPAPISAAELASTERIATQLAASGLFKDARQANVALAKVLVGRDLGLSPTESMMGIHIIEGKPELSANLQAAFVKRTPGYDYRVLEHTDAACEIAFFRDSQEIGRSRFTMDDAQRAGLGGRGPWKAYPRNMLFARAMSNGVAFHCPEVTGGLRVYAEGEISDSPPIETPPATATAPTAPTATATAPTEPTERVATAPQRRLINARAGEKGMPVALLANMLLQAAGQTAREFDGEEAARRFVNRNLDRLPARLVDPVLEAIAAEEIAG